MPIPEEKRKSRRGGRRARKMKEKYSVTQLQIQQNRVKFSTDVGEYGDSAMGLDTGNSFTALCTLLAQSFNFIIRYGWDEGHWKSESCTSEEK